jgi:hypothetical protein
MKQLNIGDLVLIEHSYREKRTKAKQAIVLCHNWQERKVEVYLIGEGRARTLHDSRVRVVSKCTNDRGPRATIQI